MTTTLTGEVMPMDHFSSRAGCFPQIASPIAIAVSATMPALSGLKTKSPPTFGNADGVLCSCLQQPAKRTRRCIVPRAWQPFHDETLSEFRVGTSVPSATGQRVRRCLASTKEESHDE